MLPRCGRAAHICGANKTVWELQQTSKRELEESQLPSKQKAEMMEQGFRGNCDSQASWGCAPALPNRIRVVSLRAICILWQRAKRFCRTTRNQFPKNQTTINIQKRIPTTGIPFFCIFTLSELVSVREPVHDCIHLSTAVWCCMFLLCKILSTMS